MTSVSRPQTSEETAQAIADAGAADGTLEIVGAGSKRGLGRPIESSGGLDLSGLAGITLYEPEELVLTVGAGTPMSTVEQALAERRQQLAFEPPDLGRFYGGRAGAGSIGGIVACNLAGPRRVKAGAVRDHVLGVKAVNGRGEAFKAGGRVVKNVTGFDLCKLLTGSHGTLAALTEVTLKVLPVPEETATLLIFGLSDGDGLRALRAALNSAQDVSGAAHLPAVVAARSNLGTVADSGAAVSCLRVEGTPASVRDRLGALRRLAGEFAGATASLDAPQSTALWRQIRDLELAVAGPDHVVWRLSLPPAAGAGAIAAVGIAGAEWFYDWGGGLVWLSLPATVDDVGADRVRAAAARAGGHAALFRAPDEVRRRVPVFEPAPEPIAALSRRIKDAFDPGHVLNRGRMAADW
jgi:glycolate oxidase FAD binding subunit